MSGTTTLGALAAGVLIGCLPGPRAETSMPDEMATTSAGHPRQLAQGWIPEGIDRPIGISFVVGENSISLTLDTIQGYTGEAKRRPIWVTIDSISFDRPPEGFDLAPACGYSEREISGEIFAVAPSEWEAAVLRGVIRAWRINLADLTLDSIPTDRLEGLVCYGFGTP